MPKCLECDKRGIFLKLTNGLCPQCSRTAQQRSVTTNTPALCTPATLSREESALISKISKINASGGELTNELYQQLREFEVNWLERNYDFNSIEGVQSIPVSKNIPGAPSPKGPMKGHTGEVYYYLRHKAYKYEEIGKMDLALVCMRKSVDLVMCRDYYSKEDCYPLVKMLARFGYIDAAYKKKNEIDKAIGITSSDDSIIKAEIKRRQELLDFKWIKEHIPDKCPKNITGYRRMKTQNTKNYQILKQAAAKLGYTLS
jgi:hypothetical protein